MNRKPTALVAVDVGNARFKLGLFPPDHGDKADDHGRLPNPVRTMVLSGGTFDLDRIDAWLQGRPPGDVAWWIASVNRPAATRLIDWLRDHRPGEAVTLLAAGDLPLEVALPRPDMVGIDRLLDAVAANHLRRPDRPAITVDLGTAITVDAVSSTGVFLGGAILPGVEMSARALHAFTDLLPLLDPSAVTKAPRALGTSTTEAMQAGLVWGAVGAIRQLVSQLGKDLGSPGFPPQVFLTGGAGPVVAELVGCDAEHVPGLLLAGIALTARHHDIPPTSG
jgi:type III pantothenate kinase